MDKIKIINIKLPFIEAVDYLNNDNTVFACTCINNNATIILNENNEIEIIKNSLYIDNLENYRKINGNLSLDNILNDEWLLIIKC